MAEDIIIRWSGPADATSGSTYKIERTLNNVDWTVLAAAQAVTAPYVSVSGALASDTAYGASQVSLSDATSFATSGYLWLDEALVQWTNKSGNNLTGCTWHSGYGTYASGSTVHVAHESYTDSSVTVSLGAAVYRVTHIDANARQSAPTYIWYYSPPVPVSSRHCVVVVNIGADLGLEARSGLGVQAYLLADTEFAEHSGAHLDKAQSSAKTQTTNAFGLTFFHCWKNSVRRPITGSDAGYAFVLDSASADKLTVTVTEIPDRDWVLLNQIATSSS
jgi:hypothetical protein